MKDQVIAVRICQIMVRPTHPSIRIGITVAEERLNGFLLMKARLESRVRNCRQCLDENEFSEMGLHSVRVVDSN